jgi:outer membrane protein assembly factor BamB
MPTRPANHETVPHGNVGTQGTGRRRSRFVPSIWVWIVIVPCSIVIVWAWQTDTMESGTANVLIYAMAAVALVSLLAWFTLFSAFGLLLRLVPISVVLITLAAAAMFVEIAGFTGAMVPSFRWRGSASPDELLRGPLGTKAGFGVDLSTTTSEDYPQFLGPDRRATVDQPVLARDWTGSAPRQLWRQPIGAGWSAFAAVNGFAVTLEQRGPNELVTCYSVRDGSLKWVHALEARHESKLGGVGPRSTPTIADGRVYALGATGVLRCLDGTSGVPLWIHDLLAMYEVTPNEEAHNVPWGRANSPLVVDQLVVVPAGGPRAGRRVSLVAFDKRSGAKVWEGGNRQISYASPTVATLQGVRQILSVNESSVSGHAVDTGLVLWEHFWPGSSNTAASASQPVAVSDHEVFVSKGYGVGAELFEVRQDEFGKWNTKSIWKRTVLKTKLTNVVIHQDHVYGLDDGILSCVELATGRRRWKHGRYGHGQILLVGDVLLVESESGEISMIEPTPAGNRELGQFVALDGKCWNNLCLYGSYLLVRNAEEAACYQLPVIRQVR